MRVQVCRCFFIDRAADFQNIKRYWGELRVFICQQATAETESRLRRLLVGMAPLLLLELFLWVVAEDQDTAFGKDEIVDLVAQLGRQSEEGKGGPCVVRKR